MEPVGPRDHAEQQVEALVPAFGMHPEPLALGFGRSPPQIDVRGAKHGQNLEQPLRVVVTVPETIDP